MGGGGGGVGARLDRVGGGARSGWEGGGEGQDGCERRIEVFVKIQKKIGGGGGGWGWIGLGGARSGWEGSGWM